MNRKLEIGLLVDNYSVPAWEYELVREIRNSEYSRIALVITPEDNSSADKRTTGQSSFIFRMHQNIDHYVFLRKQNYAVKRDIGELVKNSPHFRLRSTLQSDFSGSEPDIASELRKYNLDIIVKVGYGPVKADLSDIPEYGLWSYSMNGSDTERADTTGYYEVIEKNPVTVSELVMWKGKGVKGKVISRVTESTCSYSIGLNRDKLFSRASLFVPRIITGICINGSDYLFKLEKKYEESSRNMIKQRPVPSFLPSLFNLMDAGLIFLRQVVKKLVYTDPFTWILLYKTGAANDFSRNSYRDFTELKPLKDRFWADPFVISRDGKFFVFVEEFIYSKNKGHISVLELDDGGHLLRSDKIIEKPYHMSYPFIFEMDNVFYMIPETGGNRSIDLYRCTEFPGKWEFLKSIMKNINAVDTTLFNHSGKWWLFTVIDKIDSELAVSPELYLFYSDDFLSDTWTSHPMNPVITDVRTARPAGKIFIQDGKICRPSQDCSGSYGNSFDINQIVILTETDYMEKNIIKVRPDWNKSLKGAHTYNFDSGFTIIDAYSNRRRFF